MKKNKQIKSIRKYFLNLFYVIFLLFLIATSNTKNSIVVNNINTVKGVESSRIVKYEVNNLEKFVKVFSVQEINLNQTKKIEFTGTLTGYGADCVGCSGILGCQPHQDVRNGNIYYNDNTYGKIRILAADSSIPCGSIVKISNYKFSDDFYGIVLDRGSAIVGLTMDLLHESESDTIKIGRQYNINFKIERWGF